MSYINNQKMISNITHTIQMLVTMVTAILLVEYFCKGLSLSIHIMIAMVENTTKPEFSNRYTLIGAEPSSNTPSYRIIPMKRPIVMIERRRITHFCPSYICLFIYLTF